MPHAPFRFERMDGEPSVLRVIRFTPHGAREARIAIHAGEAEWELGEGTARLEDVADLFRGTAYAHWTAGAAHDHWRVETSVLTVRWPDGFALASTPSAPPPFDLEGEGGMRIWIQGPLPEKAVPPPQRMGAPEQQVVEIVETPGGPLVELGVRARRRRLAPVPLSGRP